MIFGLKGITKKQTIQATENVFEMEYTFDLRPRSLNFTQLSNIKAILQGYDRVQ